MIIIVYKDNKKKCEFWVVPRNGQALLGMPHTAALNIVNINIDSLEVASTWKEDCNTNIGNDKELHI